MRSLVPTLLIMAGMAFFMADVRPELVLPVIIGSLGGGLAWMVGFTQGRRRGWFEAQHHHAVQMLHVASRHLERVLASAPEDLEDDEQELLEHLQAHYQQTQELLADAGPAPRPPRGVVPER